MMPLIVSIALLLISSVSAVYPNLDIEVAGEPKIKFCNETLTNLVVLDYSFHPKDLKPDETISLSVHALLKEVVTNGTIFVDVTAGPFHTKVISKKMDLCTAVHKGNMSCPLEAKQYHIEQQIDIPDLPIKRGKVDAKVQIKDQDDSLLLCMEMECRI